MFVSPQEIRLDARPSSSSSSPAGNSSPSTLQEQFLESQKLQLKDCAKEWSSSYDTIELLKQSLKQLSTLTQQQAAAEQVVLNHSEGVSTPSPPFYNSTIENFDIQPLHVTSRSKTLSRGGSFSSQYSTGSIKSVRFGNVSIVQDLVAAHIVTTVDDFEQRERKQQQQTAKQPTTDNRLDEYVQMVQSTRQRKRTTTEGESTTKPQLARANSSSAIDDKKARTFSLFRKKTDNLNAAVLQASLQASSHPDPSDHASVASRTASRTSQRSQRSSRSISKLFSKTFGRRKGSHSHASNINDNSNHVDISEVTMEDTVTETSSNDDSGAIVKTDARYKQQPSRQMRRIQNCPVPEQAPSRRRGVSRHNSGASAASASSGIVRIAARLLSRRSSNNSDISSMASSIGSEVGHADYIPPQQIVVSSESNDDTRSSSPSSLPEDDDQVVNEDAVQLQNEIANLKKQLMGLVMEHMEESELRQEQQGMKYKQVVVAKS